MPRSEKKLNRQVKKYLKESCIEEQGFQEFFDSIVNTYAQYEDKNKMALRNLDLSSGELNDLNNQLQLLNSSMAAILDNLGPALLFFGENGVCSSVYSKSCLEILESDPAGIPIWDILKLDAAQKDSFRKLIEFIFVNNSAMGFDELFKMAPSEVDTEDQYLTIKYKPIYGSDGSLQNILVIASDETETLRTKNLLREKEERVGRLIRLIKYKQGYVNLLSDIDGYFLSGNPQPKFYLSEDLSEIMGHIHTLKGLAGSFRMNELASIFHSCEDSISMLAHSIEGVHDYFKGVHDFLGSKVDLIKEAYAAEIADAESILGDDFLQGKDECKVNYHSLYEFYEDLQGSDPSLATQFKELFLEVSLIESLEELDVYREDVAFRAEKSVAPCVVEGQDILIPLRRYDGLIESFVHIIRNSVYHGIENAEVRKKLGKDETGKITIGISSSTEKGKTVVALIFSDDGAGFNVERIKAKIAQKGYKVDDMSEDQILNSVLDDGVSSAQKVCQLAGRGVGLSEVQHQVYEMGGEIKILASDAGSKIMVKFPISDGT